MVTTRSNNPSTSTSTPTITTTTSPSPTTVEKFITLLSHTFNTVPLTTAFITEIDATPPSFSPPKPLNPQRLHQHFSLGIPTAAKANILLLHNPQFTAFALIEPPDFCGIPPSQARRNPGPVLAEWRATARAMKAKHLALPDSGPRSWDTPAAPSQSSGGPSEDPWPADFNKEAGVEVRPFYHVAIVAKEKEKGGGEEGEVVMEALLGPVLERARKEGVPVWAEASLEEKRGEYERLGFRVVEEVVVGKGRVGKGGWPEEGGEGVRCWGLLYDEHLQ